MKTNNQTSNEEKYICENCILQAGLVPKAEFLFYFEQYCVVCEQVKAKVAKFRNFKIPDENE